MNDMWEPYMKVIHGAGLGDIEEWVKLDISMTQMKVLMLLNKEKEMKVSDVAEALHTSLSNMTGILDRLEGMQFVERFPSPIDRRSVLVRLTDKANQIFINLLASGHEKLQQAAATLTEEEKTIVKDGLRLLANALDKTKKV
ncbi:MarR family transcriptional regulator [Bacillus chungangensis]|uniref:DNA-binding MarR family transcriptional regulator n=1 Tax=Bacillus chungangensis TaxID=587633 RepID=A0ABT9WWU2_9BACI|nr:MarR family transcriptional regulator [Bacillus chungangensis]MDQ0177588.1 DNA-binding MarR family transcriptional regulator [Bacillus chungangensis]